MKSAHGSPMLLSPLSYEEVAVQFFAWFDAMEAVNLVYSRQRRLEEVALNALPRWTLAGEDCTRD